MYYRRLSKKNYDNIDVVNTETLKITKRIPFTMASSRDVCNLVFADGDSLNAICTSKDVRWKLIEYIRYKSYLFNFIIIE